MSFSVRHQKGGAKLTETGELYSQLLPTSYVIDDSLTTIKLSIRKPSTRVSLTRRRIYKWLISPTDLNVFTSNKRSVMLIHANFGPGKESVPMAFVAVGGECTFIRLYLSPR